MRSVRPCRVDARYQGDRRVSEVRSRDFFAINGAGFRGRAVSRPSRSRARGAPSDPVSIAGESLPRRRRFPRESDRATVSAHRPSPAQREDRGVDRRGVFSAGDRKSRPRPPPPRGTRHRRASGGWSAPGPATRAAYRSRHETGGSQPSASVAASAAFHAAAATAAICRRRSASPRGQSRYTRQTAPG